MMNVFLQPKVFFQLIVDLCLKYIPLRLLSVLKPHKQLWIITERATDARDNGWVLFKWIREHHPEIRIIYAIKKKSNDYNNVKQLGEVVEFASWKHWYYFMTSSICCSTQWDLGIPNSLCFLTMRKILRPKSKRMFLQHGIIKDYMPQGRKHKLYADIFVCGAYPEWEYLNNVMGYLNNEVRYLGLARYDRLISTSQKRQILYMPTWRASIKSCNDVTSTTYYKTIAYLLSSNSLYNYLKTFELEFVFFVHPAIREWKKYFSHLSNDKIKVLNNEDFDLQKLICSADMLITDFSSIYFDFGYQGKPVIYYQFDYEEYRSGHYAEGYFSYERDGFGPIVKDEDTLIKQIASIIGNDWKQPEMYTERIKRFFPIRDFNNCQRHFDALCELEGIK